MSTISTSFSGFPAAGLQFMRELAQNNNKTWFEAHKSTYLSAVQAPALALVLSLGTGLHEHFPEIQYDLRTNGAGSLMRIYRDTRFSADKSPYKTNIAMIFSSSQAGKMQAPAFGLQITLEQIELYAGCFSFTPAMLNAYRSAVLDDQLGPQLEQAIAQVRGAGTYSLGGLGYKRVPAGFPADHPRAEWLKYNGLHTISPPVSLELASSPQLVDVAISHFLAMAPIQRWLVQVLAHVPAEAE